MNTEELANLQVSFNHESLCQDRILTFVVIIQVETGNKKK